MQLKRLAPACLLLAALLALAGCGGPKGAGVAMYDIVYPSGYSRDAYTLEDTAPVAGTDWQLQWRGEEMLLLGEDSSPLFSYTLAELPEGQVTLRGETATDNTLWLCGEAWAKSRYNGYVDGGLKGGRLLLVSAEDGSVLFQAPTAQNELFITSCGARCYFYSPGKAARRKADRRPARIYWRDITCWPLAHTLCSFDYVGAPRLGDRQVDRLRFYPLPEEGTLRLDFTCYEQIDAETDRWGFVVYDSAEVQLEPGWPWNMH